MRTPKKQLGTIPAIGSVVYVYNSALQWKLATPKTVGRHIKKNLELPSLSHDVAFVLDLLTLAVNRLVLSPEAEGIFRLIKVVSAG